MSQLNAWLAASRLGTGAVSINFGDGNAPYLPIQDLPYQRTHSWTDPGTYTITATGQSFCTGQASVQITVTGEAAGSAPEPSVSQAPPTPAFVHDLDDLALPLEGEPEGPGPTSVASVPPVTYALLVDIAAGPSGTVTSAPTGISCSGQDTTCSTSFSDGTSVTLIATPGSGQTFLGWGGAYSGTSTCVVSMTSDTVVTAAFASGSAATITYYHTDALGSVRATTNGSGTESAPRRDFLPFGETMSSVGGDPRQFLGTERDPETAFDAMGARYYRNVWGRFTSVDPIFTTAVTNPQRWNRYAYALNNPLRFVDPAGLDADAPHELPTDEGNGHCRECPVFEFWAEAGYQQMTKAWLQQQQVSEWIPIVTSPQVALMVSVEGLEGAANDLVRFAKELVEAGQKGRTAFDKFWERALFVTQLDVADALLVATEAAIQLRSVNRRNVGNVFTPGMKDTLHHYFATAYNGFNNPVVGGIVAVVGSWRETFAPADIPDIVANAAGYSFGKGLRR